MEHYWACRNIRQMLRVHHMYSLPTRKRIFPSNLEACLQAFAVQNW